MSPIRARFVGSHNDGIKVSVLDDTLELTLADIGIPARPQIIDRIAAETLKEAPNFRYLGDLVGADPALGASLIKTANSPFFGFNGRARSPREALMILGLDIASQAIAGISLRNAFALDTTSQKLLKTSAQIAALSGWLSRQVGDGRVRPDEAHTFGLFRDCGGLVMLKRFPEYEDIFARANAGGERPYTEMEREALPDYPLDHALVGSLLARSWWLPSEICLAIEHHHALAAFESAALALPSISVRLIAIGHTAEYVLGELSGQHCSHEWERLDAACLRLLDLTAAELPPLFAGAAEVLRGVV